MEGKTINKREILIFLFKRRWSILGIFFATIFLVTALVYLLPSNYTATSKIVVEPNKSPTLRTEARFGAEPGIVLYTEIEIASSRKIMTTVVDKLHLDIVEPPRNMVVKVIRSVTAYMTDIGLLHSLSAREKAIRSLVKYVKIKPVLDTNVFTISYAAKNPERAADIVNAITDEYIVNHRLIYSNKEALGYLRDNMLKAKAELTRLKQNLKKYKKDNRLSSSSPGSLNLVLNRLKNKLNDVQLDLTEGRSRYAAGHSHIIVLEEKEAATKKQIEEVRNQIRELEYGKDRINVFLSQIHAQETTFTNYKQQYDTALPSALADQFLSNVHVLERAAIPGAPRFPRILFIIIAILAGAMLGLMVGLIRQYYDHRVESPTQIESILDAPVIATIPLIKNKKN